MEMGYLPAVSVSQQMYDPPLFVVPSVNVTPGVKEDRMMMTGMHTVSDIFCVGCGSIVGWKYVRFVKFFP